MNQLQFNLSLNSEKYARDDYAGLYKKYLKSEEENKKLKDKLRRYSALSRIKNQKS